MRTGSLSTKRSRWGSLSLCQAAAFLCAFSAHAKNSYEYKDVEMNQHDTMGYSSNNYVQGSDDSKDEGVRNGMRALNRLASLDIGGAINYGYKGYGNYINSQKMDDLDARAWKLKNTMNSANNNFAGGVPGASGSGGSTNSSGITGASQGSKRRLMSDMDRSFLYRGETAEVAAEFEKRSGMSREEFFNHLASVADSGLSWDDPQLMEKVEQHYQAFVGRIPNKDFRSSIEKAHSMFDLVKRAQIVEEAAAFYKKNRWGDDSAPQQYAENEKQENTGATAPATAAASPVKSENADRSPSSLGTPVVATAKTEESTPKLSKEQMGGYLGLGGGGDELSELMTSDDADSIFRLVSKRYRKLTPALLGKAVVLEAK